MTKKQKEEVLKTIKKKSNMAYWDTINDAVTTFLLEFVQFSYNDVACYEDEEDEDDDMDMEDREISEDFIEAICDVRDYLVKYLEKNFNAWFPYVDESY